jgi:hypothetical protein
VLGGPLAGVLEIGDELDRRHELVLLEHQDGLGLEPPGVRIRVPRLARPDLGAVLVELAGDLDHPPERLNTGDVEDDAVTRLDLLREVPPPLLHADDAEAGLARGAEVVQGSGEDPRLGGHRGQG